MWSEWLRKTLRPNRDEPAEGEGRPHRRHVPPDLEADGMHPGSDEFRAALERMEAE
jgi:hypothetical protein